MQIYHESKRQIHCKFVLFNILGIKRIYPNELTNENITNREDLLERQNILQSFKHSHECEV